MPARTQSFLSYLGDNLYNSIPVKSLWELNLSVKGGSGSELIKGINNVLNIYEGSGTDRKRFKEIKTGNSIFGVWDDGTPTGLSFLVQSVTLPTDAFGVEYTDTTGLGGFRGGYYGMEREKYQSIDIEFLETFKDVFEFFIRPWSIAVGYKGLIEDGDPNTNLKADMDVTLYSRSEIGTSQSNQKSWSSRKRYHFTGVVPVSVPGETLSYDPVTDKSRVVRQASFAFADYFVV